MNKISIPQTKEESYWDGTSGVKCTCGGLIEWAEAAYVPGTRACRTCLKMYQIRGSGEQRALVVQSVNNEGIIGDIEDGEEPYLVPKNLYPGWYVEK